MKNKTLNPKFVHIGMFRYADQFQPTNKDSQERWIELLHKAGHKCTDSNCSLERGFPRAFRVMVSRMARSQGYELHFFEKGLGR